MPKNTVSFNWEYEFIPGLDKIFRPYVPIYLKTVDAGWKPFNFLVDSGADVSMLPYSMSDILGIDLSDLPKSEATGIGGYSIKTWKTKLPIKIEDWELKIAVTFTSDNLTPLLLGRTDTLDTKFSWFFDYRKKKIIFKK